MKTVIGVFDNMTQAEAAIRDLTAAGFAREQISLVAANADGRYNAAATTTAATDDAKDRRTEHAVAGAGIGAAAGGVGGLLLGLGALAIPGIGPIIAAGPLAAALAGAGIGAAAGGLIGALTTAGVPDEYADTYAEAVRRGGHLVSVSCQDQMVDRAMDVMERNGAVDVDERATAWRSEGWTGRATTPIADTAAASARSTERRAIAGAPAAAAAATNEQQRIPVIREDVAVGKRTVERGGVRVFSRVVEQPVQKDIELKKEKVVVERRPVDRPVQGADWDSFREGAVELTERAEEPVVRKEARVVEEVVVGKQVTSEHQTVRETVRRTDVQVQPLAAGGAQRSSASFEDHAADFRRDFDANYARSGYTYAQYEPMYRYGYDLANDARFAGRDWAAVEPELQRDFATRHPGSMWDRAKASVRYAWERARTRA